MDSRRLEPMNPIYPHIEQLRAFAVLLVLGYHLGLPLLSSGFVGVDVFLVVSGFVVASSLMRRGTRPRDFGKFLVRRFFRLFPALFLMVLVTLVLSFASGNFTLARQTSTEALGAIFGVSNFVFWSNSGYFDPPASQSPLLHTWSLGLEEQFYLFLPLVFFVTAIFPGARRRLDLLLVASLTAFSFALSVIGLAVAPAATFYLLPTRAWEFGVGVILAILSQKSKVTENLGVGRAYLLKFAGFSLLVFSLTIDYSTTGFPGQYALPAVLGTGLIILGGLRVSIPALRILEPVGRISYSVYLWHFPIIFFLDARLSESPVEKAFAIFLTFASAYFSYRYVELPFRPSKKLHRRQRAGVSAAAYLVIISLSFAGQFSNIQQRFFLEYVFDADQVAISKLVLANDLSLQERMQASVSACSRWFDKSPMTAEKTLLSNCTKQFGKGTLVIGDSHAMGLTNILQLNGGIDYLISISSGGCRLYSDCHSQAIDWAISNKEFFETIIYHQEGSTLVADPSRGHLDKQYMFMVKDSPFVIDLERISIIRSKLEQLTMHFETVFMIGPRTEYRFDPGNAATSKTFWELNPESLRIYSALDNYLELVFLNSSVKFVRLAKIIDRPNTVFDNSCFYWEDADHYSGCAEKAFSGGLNLSGIVQRWSG